MIKSYVLDTNVLLLDPEAMFKFEDNNVIIPIGVIEELDRFKKDQSELGKNARQISRLLDDLRNKGDLREGVPVGDGKVMVRYNGNLESYLKENNVDLHVIHIAQKTIDNDPETPCIVVSRDINVRIRANALGIKAENYEGDQINHHEMDSGYSSIVVDGLAFDEFASQKVIDIKKFITTEDVYPNHYFVIYNSETRSSLLGKVDQSCCVVKSLIQCPQGVGLFPKNKEQTFLIDALMDSNIKLVSIAGGAGTGKTLLATAIGYYLTVHKKEYKRLLVSRPVFPMGKDIGFLPGDKEEKLDPWMCPIYDAFDVINGNSNVTGRSMINGKNVVVEPLTYIRGRSIRDQFLIVDEAQNLSTHEIKTIITRAGENTKVVLTGDIYQIDNPYIDSLSNGLSVVMMNMKDSSLSAHIVLEKGVRSALADEAAIKL
jgi:PhoH-like ATPase